MAGLAEGLQAGWGMMQQYRQNERAEARQKKADEVQSYQFDQLKKDNEGKALAPEHQALFNLSKELHVDASTPEGMSKIKADPRGNAIIRNMAKIKGAPEIGPPHNHDASLQANKEAQQQQQRAQQQQQLPQQQVMGVAAGDPNARMEQANREIAHAKKEQDKAKIKMVANNQKHLSKQIEKGELHPNDPIARSEQNKIDQATFGTPMTTRAYQADYKNSLDFVSNSMGNLDSVDPTQLAEHWGNIYSENLAKQPYHMKGGAQKKVKNLIPVDGGNFKVEIEEYDSEGKPLGHYYMQDPKGEAGDNVLSVNDAIGDLSARKQYAIGTLTMPKEYQEAQANRDLTPAIEINNPDSDSAHVSPYQADIDLLSSTGYLTYAINQSAAEAAAEPKGTWQAATQGGQDVLYNNKTGETRVQGRHVFKPSARRGGGYGGGRGRGGSGGGRGGFGIGAAGLTDVNGNPLAHQTAASINLLDKAQTAMFESQKSAQAAGEFLQNFEAHKDEYTSGKIGSMGEYLKQVFGSEDAISELNRQYIDLQNGYVLQNLPKGSASDKDVDMFQGGAPKATASFKDKESWVRGVKKAAELNADFNRIKAETIEKNGSTAGFTAAWNAHVKEKFAQWEEERKQREGAESEQKSSAQKEPDQDGHVDITDDITGGKKKAATTKKQRAQDAKGYVDLAEKQYVDGTDGYLKETEKLQ
ncbi:hypothetical protein [Photobacterium angustum]|uniref:hypothetical protein n=1 Tax=Photobacterium angustum TaxID=661 RepID=UPI0005DFA551|nr:hypothetical protein [Photobacterium angustum]KJG00122.1 hypothetical protein UB35_19935 [Photobacterium angustum]PSV61683.1 hypothetical protein CTM95_20490 [Photobacterium angustum]